MSTDSSFQDKPLGSVPSMPDDDMDNAPDPDEPMPNDPLENPPMEPDPLARPTVMPGHRPEDWKDPGQGDGVPADKDMPLPND